MKRRGQLNRRAQRRGPFAPERSARALANGGVSNRFVLQTICLATLLALDVAPAWAQDATWLENPSTESFNDRINWTTGVVPTGAASFGTSGQLAPLNRGGYDSQSNPVH